MRKLITLAVLACSLCGTWAARAEVTYRPGEGFTSGEEEPVADSASEQFQRGEKYENEGENGRALSAYRALVKKYPDSTSAPRAQLKVAEFYEKGGDPNKAFDAYGLYLSKYPKGEEFDRAVEAQFRIAKLFLDGQRKKVLGIPTFSSMQRAQEMFQGIIKNAPYSRFAPLAQFNIGQALEKQGEFAAAVSAYETVLSRYPTDSVAADAQYQIAYVYLRQSREGSNDNMAAAKARDAFDDFVARYPDSEKAAQARENLGQLTGKQTRNNYEIGRFYEKQKKYKAAVVYYNDAIKQQPDAPQSQLAKGRIEDLRAKVGDDALKPGPERTENPARASMSRKLQAQVDTSARADYLGPPVIVPDEVPAAKPRLRTSTDDVTAVPAVEPTLPEQ